MHIRESDGQTSLHFAVLRRHTGVIEKLMDLKPELVSKEDNLGRTPLHVAALIPPLKELVIPPFYPWSYAIHAKKNLRIATMLLKKDPSLCYKLDNEGQTPLHIGAKEGNVAIVKLILQQGGDCIEMVDKQKRNALQLAVINAEVIFDRNSGAMVEMLHSLASTTKRFINNCDIHRKRPLDIAINNIAKDELLFSCIIKVLEANGAIRDFSTVVEVELKNVETSKPRWKTEMISLNAVLIGTVAFTAPLDLIGGSKPLQGDYFKSTPNYERIFYIFLFYVFMIFDALALGTSVASTMLLMVGVFGNKEESSMVQTSLLSVKAALISILFAFGSAIGLALGPEYLWLTLTVWFMLCVTPGAILIRSFRCKLFLHKKPKNLVLFILEDALGLIIIMFYDFFIGGV